MRHIRSFCVLLLLLAVAGCTPKSEPAQLLPNEPAADLEWMRAEDVRSQISSTFPLEVPVPAGAVVAGQSQGPDAWDYQMTFPESADEVAEWYRRAYGSRSWTVVSDSVNNGDAAGTLVLAFRKGAAECEVVVSHDGRGSHASVSLGIGTPVLTVQ